jgi:hypothetical protein
MHTLVGAYVMDAVTGREEADFERHLAVCEQCRDDVRGLREAAARLGAATAIAPRPELRERTVRAAGQIRQLPPVLAGGPAGRRGVRRHGAVRRRGVGVRGGAGVQGGAGWRSMITWRSWLPAIAASAAAALAATAIVLGVHLNAMQGKLSSVERRDTAIAAVLGSHDATTLSAEVMTGGTATVVMSHRAGALVFTAHGLARLPASEAYELWLMGPAGLAPAGMLPAGHDGMSGPVVVTKLAPGDWLGMTIEPSAGSGRPTSALVVMVSLGA